MFFCFGKCNKNFASLLEVLPGKLLWAHNTPIGNIRPIPAWSSCTIVHFHLFRWLWELLWIRLTQQIVCSRTAKYWVGPTFCGFLYPYQSVFRALGCLIWKLKVLKDELRILEQQMPSGHTDDWLQIPATCRPISSGRAGLFPTPSSEICRRKNSCYC